MGNTWMHGLFWLLYAVIGWQFQAEVPRGGDRGSQNSGHQIGCLDDLYHVILVACAVRRRLVQDDTIQYTFVNMSSILLQVKIRRIEVWWCLPKHGLEGSWRIMDHWIEPFWHCEMCINKYSWGFGMSFFSQRFSKDVDSASYRQVPRAIPRSWGLGIPGTMVGLKVKPLTNGWGNLFYTRRG